MSDFRRYFSYHFIASLPRLAAVTLLCVILTVMTVSGGCDVKKPENSNCSIYILSVIISACASIMPILEFSEYNNKRNLDTVFSLPVKRRSIAAVNYLNGLIHTYLIFTVCTVAASITMLQRIDYFSIIYIIPYYLTAIALSAIVYSISSFIFLKANTTFDGILFIIMWIGNIYYAVTSVYYWMRHSFQIKYFDFRFEYLVLFEPIDSYTMHFQDLINESADAFDVSIAGHIYTALWAVAAIICTIGIFRTFDKKRAECAGEISDSIFGYKLNIPLYMISISLSSRSYYFCIFIFLCAVAGYFVYRRGVRLKKGDIVTLILSLAASLCGLYILIS